MSVSEEEDGRAAGGRTEAADTELKTKTPHVNVGKKLLVWFRRTIATGFSIGPSYLFITTLWLCQNSDGKITILNR